MSHQLTTYLDANWQRQVENVRQAVARLWERPAHRHAVDHGPAHADRIVALLDGLTEGLMTRSDRPLAMEEIYILLAAAHLHAIGLQDEQTEPDPAARWTRYPALGAEMIYRALETPEAVRLGLTDDPGLVEMVARVVAHHRDTSYSAPGYDDFPVGNVTVRPRLLTALLHLADGLDLDYRRVDLEQLKLMAAAPEEALDWWLHHYVSGVQVRDEYVRIGYRVPTNAPAYEELLPKLVEHQVRADFEALRDIFRLYSVKVDLAPPTAVRPMRAVKPMPADVWAAAEHRLARLKGAEPLAPPEPQLSPEAPSPPSEPPPGISLSRWGRIGAILVGVLVVTTLVGVLLLGAGIVGPLPTPTPTPTATAHLGDAHVSFIITPSGGEQFAVPAGGTLYLTPGDGIVLEMGVTWKQSPFPRTLSFQYCAPKGYIPAGSTGPAASYVAPIQAGPDVITVRITDPTTRATLVRSINIVVR